jgi:hypothetical protein
VGNAIDSEGSEPNVVAPVVSPFPEKENNEGAGALLDAKVVVPLPPEKSPVDAGTRALAMLSEVLGRKEVAFAAPDDGRMRALLSV